MFNSTVIPINDLICAMYSFRGVVGKYYQKAVMVKFFLIWPSIPVFISFGLNRNTKFPHINFNPMYWLLVGLNYEEIEFRLLISIVVFL